MDEWNNETAFIYILHHDNIGKGVRCSGYDFSASIMQTK